MIFKLLYSIATKAKFIKFRINKGKSIVKHILNRIMDREIPVDILLPPVCVKEMKVLDRDRFVKTVEIPFVTVKNDEISLAKKILKDYLLKMPNLVPVCETENNRKNILLNPLAYEKSKEAIEDALSIVKSRNVDWMKISLNYENWKYDEILTSVLPSYHNSISSFSRIGHIIHLNVKDHFKDYRYLIGQVLLDKHATVRTVVNKINTIDNTYRNFELEVLSGEPEFQVSVKENGHKFEFDFAKVFWNPRLNNEHLSVVQKFQKGDTVFDVFAGVGPFAIPAAKKSCTVFANDLNPESYKWLCHNNKLNKTEKNLSVYNMDGRDFIREVVKEKLENIYKSQAETKVNIIMNLPASALQFLDAFKRLITTETEPENKILPTVYCYYFEKKDKKELDQYLDAELKNCIEEVHHVRNVAPNKEMYRLVLKLPTYYLFHVEEYCEPSCKRQRANQIQ